MKAFGAWRRGSGDFEASRGGKRAAAVCYADRSDVLAGRAIKPPKSVQPAAGVVIDAQDLQHLVVYSVRDDEGRFGDDEFARAGHAAGVRSRTWWRRRRWG
jgi:hypothetical protein